MTSSAKKRTLAMRLVSGLEAALAVVASAAVGCSGAETDSKPPAPEFGFVQVENGKVVDESGRAVWLRGINHGLDVPSSPVGEDDYARMSALGANVVGLTIDANAFEDDEAPGFKAGGFAALDDSVRWAREQRLHLILVMGVAPGAEGPWVECGNDAFWDGPEYQERLIALWRAIAERYADEPVVAGYSLLDAPNPNRDLEQWRTLAERVAAGIREEDPRHTLIVDRALSVACVFDKNAEESFALIDDPNVLYGFDRFQPWRYVAQMLESSGLPEYSSYPSQMIEWLHDSTDSRPGLASLLLQPDETDWVERKFFYTVTDPKFVYGTPVLQSDFNPGTAYFDDIAIDEYDENFELLGRVREFDLENITSWYLWQGVAGNEVEGTGVATVSSDAHAGEASIAISGTTTNANMNREANQFPVTLGHTYELTGWIKGRDIEPTARAGLRMDFWGYRNGSAGFDRSTLEALFTDFVAWGRAHDVPLIAGPFGTGHPTFENERGGITWARDMLDIMIENELHFLYHSYNDADYGIYGTVGGYTDPSVVNQPLAELLNQKLR